MKRSRLTSTQPMGVPMSEASQQGHPRLRRLLEKTKPVPFAIWMTTLALIVTSPISLIGWATEPTAPVRAVLLIQLFMCCLGGLMGLLLGC
jgi:hypothetical protein